MVVSIRIQIETVHDIRQILSYIHNTFADSYEPRSRNNSEELLISGHSPSDIDYNGRFWTLPSQNDQMLKTEYMACNLILFGIMAGVRTGDRCLHNVEDTKQL